MSSAAAVSEWWRALNCLGAARSCYRDGYFADAISRAYYTVLHAAKASIEAMDIDAPRTHHGVSNLFGQHIVLPGLVERTLGANIRRLYSLRNRADYDTDAQFSADDAQAAISAAQSFLVPVRALLSLRISDPDLP